MNSFPILSALWLVPLAGAAIVTALPPARRTLAKYVALGTSFLVLTMTEINPAFVIFGAAVLGGVLYR